MKVIQTHYRGHYFRSRLEARYAVFFDALNEKWVYEKEGYDLDEGDFYLPDFWLPRLECHVEIKGQYPKKEEIRKCRKLQFFTEHDVVIFDGLPTENYGLWFGWCDNGGFPTESYAAWTIDDGFLALTDYAGEPSDMLQAAAVRAKQARFQRHDPDLPIGVPYPNIVDYDRIPF